MGDERTAGRMDEVVKVFADQSISLHGFSTGPNVAVGNGMGDGGERLHEWMFPAESSLNARG